MTEVAFSRGEVPYSSRQNLLVNRQGLTVDGHSPGKEYHSCEQTVECRNIRNETYKKPPAYKAELQKTRNSMDGRPTRGYSVDESDVLGVSLLNQTGEWDCLFVATERLARRLDLEDFLVVMQLVPMAAETPWTTDPLDAFAEAIPDES
ncbi:MAG: hypothetical protein JXQ75_21460 [Phycisphaerae bacterium]|nr:hypothetical protein [Phycisphaerae bacterium]